MKMFAKCGENRRGYKGRITQKFAANRRWHIIRDAALEGKDLDEAARLAGIKPASARVLIFKKTGRYVYPPVE